jgi:hypothetical protein
MDAPAIGRLRLASRSLASRLRAMHTTTETRPVPATPRIPKTVKKRQRHDAQHAEGEEARRRDRLGPRAPATARGESDRDRVAEFPRKRHATTLGARRRTVVPLPGKNANAVRGFHNLKNNTRTRLVFSLRESTARRGAPATAVDPREPDRPDRGIRGYGHPFPSTTSSVRRGWIL